jgi:hypothetical protein
MLFVENRLEKEKEKEDFKSSFVDGFFYRYKICICGLKASYTKKQISVNYLHLPKLKGRLFPTWDTLIARTPPSAHLLIILGKVETNSEWNHYIAINLLNNVVYDGTANGVAFHLNVRTVALSVLKVPIAAVTITFTDDNFIVENMIPDAGESIVIWARVVSAFRLENIALDLSSVEEEIPAPRSMRN